MQNLPGLSFFDGLTRSRPSSANNANHNPGAGSPSSGSSASFGSTTTRQNSHPLAEQELVDSFSPLTTETTTTTATSTSTISGGSSSSFGSDFLPAASFSRRAATIAAGKATGAPTSTSSSSSSRPSILPSQNIFSPVSSKTDKSRRTSVSSSTSSILRPYEPLSDQDSEKLVQGTQGHAVLKRLEDQPEDLKDIINMLVSKKAILLLSLSLLAPIDPTPGRIYLEDHVIITESSKSDTPFMTLSGIRGMIRSPKISLYGMATGQDFGLQQPTPVVAKRSLFNTLSSKPVEPVQQTTMDLAMANTSLGPALLDVPKLGTILVILMDGSVEKPSTPIPATGPASVSGNNNNASANSSNNNSSSSVAAIKSRVATNATLRRAGNSSSASSVIQQMIDEEPNSIVPKTLKIATDVPLEWEGMVRDLYSFVAKLQRNPLATVDQYSHEFQLKYDEVRHRFEVFGTESGMGKARSWTDTDFDQVEQWAEWFLCREFYHLIFAQPGDVRGHLDYEHDEQLQAKIAALNFMDLSLEHLGFSLLEEHPQDMEHIAKVVKEGGKEMQKLALFKSPLDKLNVLLSSHRVVIETLNKEPSVQALVEATPGAVVEVKEEAVGTDGVREAMKTDAPEKESVTSPKVDEDNNTSPSAKESGSTEETKKDESGGVEEETSTDEAAVKPYSPVASTADGKDDSSIVVSPATPTGTTSTSASPSGTSTPPSASSPTSTATAAAAVTAAAPKKQYSADVLLPLLIFSVVKSNPPMLISNLRYIQRFRVQDQLSGEAAYCLTNMMAAVSFLETLDPKALGLGGGSIRVVMNDLVIDPLLPPTQKQDRANVSHPQPQPSPIPLINNFQEGFDHTKALGHKVSQEIVGVAEDGIKAISDVVQGGYSKFLGRLLDGGPPGSLTNVHRSPGRSSSAASEKQQTIMTTKPGQLAEGLESGMYSPAPGLSVGPLLTAATGSPASASASAAAATVTVSALNATSENQKDIGAISSVHESAVDHIIKSRALDLLRSAPGAQIHYMAVTSVEDLRIGDVRSLLEDYQRLGKLIADLKQLAQ